MKITKAKLKQIISEELSSMSEYGTMIRNKFPDEYPEHLEAIDRIHDRLKGMQTGAGNEVALAMDS